jgi:hypothetical protein
MKINSSNDLPRTLFALLLCLTSLAFIILLIVASLALILTSLGVAAGWYTLDFFKWQVDTGQEALLLSGFGLLGGLGTWLACKGTARLLGPVRA